MRDTPDAEFQRTAIPLPVVSRTMLLAPTDVWSRDAIETRLWLEITRPGRSCRAV